jgi:hypothetical protein
MAEHESKYDQYFIKDTLGFNFFPPYAPRLVFDTRNYFPEMGFGIRYTYITQPIQMEKPHAHDFDQFFCFMGTPEDQRVFDGEVEVYLGEEQAKFVIGSTTVLFVPKGLIHTPFNWVKVNKPMMFLNIVLSNKYTRTEEGYWFPDSLEIEDKKVTEEEAGHFLGVDIPKPAYLPRGFKIQAVYIQDDMVKLIISDKPLQTRLMIVGDAKSTRQQYRFDGKWDIKAKYFPQGYPGELNLRGEKVKVGDYKGIWVDRERNFELNWLQPAKKGGQFWLVLSTGKGATRDEVFKVALSIK